MNAPLPGCCPAKWAQSILPDCLHCLAIQNLSVFGHILRETLPAELVGQSIKWPILWPTILGTTVRDEGLGNGKVGERQIGQILKVKYYQQKYQKQKRPNWLTCSLICAAPASTSASQCCCCCCCCSFAMTFAGSPQPAVPASCPPSHWPFVPPCAQLLTKPASDWPCATPDAAPSATALRVQ